MPSCCGDVTSRLPVLLSSWVNEYNKAMRSRFASLLVALSILATVELWEHGLRGPSFPLKICGEAFQISV
jgi:hypothetical protein